MARILIADDIEFMRDMLRSILTDEGHEVVSAVKNGMEAVEEYIRVRPDLVTLDVMMPQMDGIHSLQAIRRIDPNGRVIMVTSVQSYEMIKTAFKNGACGFIMKPFQRLSVLNEIEKVINDSEA